jgi:hypothetical protein
MRPALPDGHGEVLTQPAFDRWPETIQANVDASAKLAFAVAGTDAKELRERARREAVAEAVAFSARLGVPVVDPPPVPGRIVMTGHQPELYHPGIWSKGFFLQRLADATGAVPVDLVVDTDGFRALELSCPCPDSRTGRKQVVLVQGGDDLYYAGVPVPAPEAIDGFCEAGTSMVAGLPAPAIGRHFAAFCAELKRAIPPAKDLAELITIARRRYEAPAGTRYLELPVTRLARTPAFLAFVADILLRADQFAEVYNRELALYRSVNRTRSSAQPFPDLKVTDESTEVPFWALEGSRRSPVTVSRAGGSLTVHAAGRVLLNCEADPVKLANALRSAVTMAPKAVALTLFSRVFLSDLFIHGFGGARYDSITDAVARGYWEIEPPAFVVASMTLYLPVGAHVVSDAELAEARHRVKRFEHNPDSMLSEAEFDDPRERARAIALAEEKTSLVSLIGRDGSDKKALGTRIRAVNAELASILEPVGTALRSRLKELESQHEAFEALTDRTYPFCFFSPLEVQDKVG